MCFNRLFGRAASCNYAGLFILEAPLDGRAYHGLLELLHWLRHSRGEFARLQQMRLFEILLSWTIRVVRSSFACSHGGLVQTLLPTAIDATALADPAIIGWLETIVDWWKSRSLSRNPIICANLEALRRQIANCAYIRMPSNHLHFSGTSLFAPSPQSGQMNSATLCHQTSQTIRTLR